MINHLITYSKAPQLLLDYLTPAVYVFFYKSCSSNLLVSLDIMSRWDLPWGTNPLSGLD